MMILILGNIIIPNPLVIVPPIISALLIAIKIICNGSKYMRLYGYLMCFCFLEKSFPSVNIYPYVNILRFIQPLLLLIMNDHIFLFYSIVSSICVFAINYLSGKKFHIVVPIIIMTNVMIFSVIDKKRIGNILKLCFILTISLALLTF